MANDEQTYSGENGAGVGEGNEVERQVLCADDELVAASQGRSSATGPGAGRLAGWALAGALCLGANIVPMMVFVGLAIRHPGEYAFLLPVVMFFASARSVVFALQGIGSIENPARIALASLALAASGVAIALFGEIRHPLWSVGAVLVGCGMGAYAPMFRTVRDGLKREGKWTAQASTPASYLLLVIILALVAVLRRGMVEAALAAYLALVVANLAFMRVELRGRVAGRMFAFGGRSRRAAVYAAAALVAALAVCFLRETADAAYALAVLCACTVLLLVAAFATPRPPGRRARRTFWYGACRSFLLVFSLLYCTATGQGGLLFAAYACYGLGIGASKLVSKPIERLTGLHCEAVCMLGAFASCCLLLAFSAVPWCAGVLLGCLFSSMGNSRAIRAYLADESIPFNNRHLARTKMFSTGAVVAQGVALLAVFAAAMLTGDSALSAFVYSQGDAANAAAFACALPVCLAVSAAGMAVAFPRRSESL